MTSDVTDITMAPPWSMVDSSSDHRHGDMDDGDDDTDDDDTDDDTDDHHDDDTDDDNDHKNDSYTAAGAALGASIISLYIYIYMSWFVNPLIRKSYIVSDHSDGLTQSCFGIT